MSLGMRVAMLHGFCTRAHDQISSHWCVCRVSSGASSASLLTSAAAGKPRSACSDDFAQGGRWPVAGGPCSGTLARGRGVPRRRPSAQAQQIAATAVVTSPPAACRFCPGLLCVQNGPGACRLSEARAQPATMGSLPHRAMQPHNEIASYRKRPQPDTLVSNIAGSMPTCSSSWHQARQVHSLPALDSHTALRALLQLLCTALAAAHVAAGHDRHVARCCHAH